MESLVHYTSPAHALTVLAALNEQRLRAHLCDVVLAVGGRSYPAHRSVLAASSEYFSALFSRGGGAVVHLDFCEPRALETVLGYLYSASLLVDRGGLAAVQELGYSLGIPFLRGIASARPQASYRLSAGNVTFSEEEEEEDEGEDDEGEDDEGEDEREGGDEREDEDERDHDDEAMRNRSVIVHRAAPESATPSPGPLNERPATSSTLRSRPQLTSSASFGEIEPGYRRGAVDRSGPLIKSLLRRSLSMDSPVPVFSPVLELKEPVKTEEGAEPPARDVGTDPVPVKREACSPLPDPAEIIRITVQDRLPVGLRDYHGAPRAKRRAVPGPPGVARGSVDPPPVPVGVRSGKALKCRACAKVFRSGAGLYRHVNMYHNPEKPYSCQVCLKRFHTNFKVWTHCQAQHGVVQNPAAPPCARPDPDPDPDQSLQRKLKRALVVKLGGTKPGHAPARGSRPYVCPHCGKAFRLQSHLKLHVKGHADDGGVTGDDPPDDPRAFPCRLCDETLGSAGELRAHEAACRGATVCPYCGLRFSGAAARRDHEAGCRFKKLTCLTCTRTFRSSFSIWRHQMEVHNRDATGAGGDSDDSSGAPEDLSARGRPVVKEEPQEEPVSGDQVGGDQVGEEPEGGDQVGEEPEGGEREGEDQAGAWPCEKCAKLFFSRPALERHQELLCHVKPFICHVCHKAFRTNFRLWSHHQSHSGDPASGDASPSPSPPLSAPPLSAPPLSDPPSSAPPLSDPGDSATSGVTSLPGPGGDGAEDPSGGAEPGPAPRGSGGFFYHAPALSALAFKRQFVCKMCYRTFKTAFSLWSHEQSHGHA